LTNSTVIKSNYITFQISTNIEDFDFNSGLSALNCAFGDSITTFKPAISIGWGSCSYVSVMMKADPSI
jgi:hypothetical protein